MTRRARTSDALWRLRLARRGGDDAEAELIAALTGEYDSAAALLIVQYAAQRPDYLARRRPGQARERCWGWRAVPETRSRYPRRDLP